ncbi:MAG: succinate dehydrogenase, cytochrome b556 subunit [Steroidobacteraceae bacterium]
MRERPLSPHLDVYRFWPTMALSITHRITGVILSVGLLLLAWWLMAAAGDAAGYAAALAVLGSTPVKLLLAGWLLAFVYHFVNGIRHLSFDAGLGMEKHEARRSGVIAVVVTLLGFALLGWLLFLRHGGAA